MKANFRKFILTSHITFSVSWLGAIAVFLTLAITGLKSDDIQLARSCCLAMDLCAWFTIVPFCLTSLITGIVQAASTKWGLFKYYWIVLKLFLTVICTILLLLHLQPISYLAGVATGSSFSNSLQSGQLINLITKAGAAVLALITITTISVYKPWGKIKNEHPNNQVEKMLTQKEAPFTKKSWKQYLLIGFAVLITLIIIKHLLEGGIAHY